MKHFKKIESLYVMKPQYSIALIVVGGCFGMAFLGYYVDQNILMWLMLFFGILSAIAFSRKTLSIDLDKKVIIARSGAAAPLVSIPINRIQNFELTTISNYLFKTNAMLSAYYLDEDGKEKSILIAQGFTVKTMQSFLNEIEEIIDHVRD